MCVCVCVCEIMGVFVSLGTPTPEFSSDVSGEKLFLKETFEVLQMFEHTNPYTSACLCVCVFVSPGL